MKGMYSNQLTMPVTIVNSLTTSQKNSFQFGKTHFKLPDVSFFVVLPLYF